MEIAQGVLDIKKHGKKKVKAEDILKSSIDKVDEQWNESHEGAATLDFERIEDEYPQQVYKMKSKGKE